MTSPRVLLVTGKGGTGKSTIAAALGMRAAAKGLRALIVEAAPDGTLPRLFGRRAEDGAIHRLAERLDGFRVDSRRLVEDYFTSVLRFSFLSSRLFESSSFNALTAAAPGITEFLLLSRVVDWIEPAALRRRRYDLVIIDGPATGHALKLVRAPQNLAAMVPAGPLARAARQQTELIGDWQRWRVVLVALPEDLAVRETIETYRALQGDAIAVARPVVNRVFPRRFSSSEARAIDRLAAARDAPELAAAQFAIAARRDAERHIGRLRRSLETTPFLLPLLFESEWQPSDLLRAFGRRLDRVAGFE